MRLALALVLLGACFDPTPPPDGPYVESHVDTRQVPEQAPPELDVLVFVDNTTAMAPYQSTVGTLPTTIARAIESIYDGWPDVRIAVTTNGGALSPVLATKAEWDGSFTNSYDATLESELATLVSVGADRSAPSQPLAALRTALESSPSFLRDGATLGVLIVTASDDASPSADYAAWLTSQKADRSEILVSGIDKAPNPALDAFVSAFPYGSTQTPIDAGDLAPAVTAFRQLFRWAGGGQCLDAMPVDDDPTMPGDQYACEFSAWDGDREIATLPACNGGEPTAGSCWEIGRSSPDCVYTPSWALRGSWSNYHPELRIQCVTGP